MTNTETAGAGAKPERTPQDYAIEHAEYLAQDAERLLDAINHLNAQHDEDGDAFDSDALARAEEAVTEAFGSVRNGIYEFRKRRDRATAQPAGAQQPGAAYAALIHDLEVIVSTTLHATIEGSRKSHERDTVRKAIEVIRACHGQAPAGESLRTDALCDLSYSHGLKAGWNYCASDDLAGFERAQKIGAEALRTLKSPTAQAAPAAEYLRTQITGMSVSVDVSTDDATAGHRYFGTVTEVMECQGDKHGITLLVQDAEPNFKAQPAPAAVAGCTRSHPHENMDSSCRAKTAIAEMQNMAARGAEATAQDLERFVRMLAAAPAAAAQAAPAAVEGPHVTDAMALAFHSALSDGAIGSDEVEDIKTGLRAVLAAAPTAQPAPQQDDLDAITLLAECRDAFPTPEHGSPIENEWMAACSDPSEVPGYMRAIAGRMAQPSPAAQGDALTQAARDVLARKDQLNGAAQAAQGAQA